MGKVWYGSIANRIDEGKNFTKRELRVGDDITMYYWSDRTCYYITKVVNQKNIFVHKYEVVADQEKEGGMGHQNWVYFKTVKECNDYLKKFGIDDRDSTEYNDEEWVFRYNHWYEVTRYDMNTWNTCLANARKDCKPNAPEESIINLARFYLRLNDEDFAKLLHGEKVVKYYRIEQGISFGVRDYYYDWEF